MTLLIAYIIKNKEQNIVFPKYPSISKIDSINKYWEIEIKDPYRNLENSNDSTVQSWYNAQGLYTENIINNISNRDSLASFLSEIDNRRSYYISRLNITENDFYFYLKMKNNEKKRKLYFKKGFDGEEILLFDPKDFKSETENDYHNYVGNVSYDFL